MNGIAATLLAAATACAVPQADVSLQASLDYEAFDSRGEPYGWRYLTQVACTDAALSLLAAYATANEARLTVEQRLELAFHAGQALAFAGRDAESIPHFERALSEQANSEWEAYVGATLAFLRRDASALIAARKAYAAIAPTSMRLTIIDGFIACPHEPYSKAVHCAM